MSGHTHIHTHRTTTVTLTAHARRGLMTKILRDLIGKLAQGMKLLNFLLFKSLYTYPSPQSIMEVVGHHIDRYIINIGNFALKISSIISKFVLVYLYFVFQALQKDVVYIYDGIRT